MAIELAVRTAMTKLGAGLLEQLLASDTGHRGPRIDCGSGHLAEFVSYRGKTLDTVLGPITLNRAYYHCSDCGHGVVPRDEELGVSHASLTPGLAAMTDRVGTAVAFAKGRDLLAELAGLELSTKRVERCAEADGKAIAAAIDTYAACVATGEVVPLPPAGAIPKLYVAVDGTGIPAVPAGHRSQEGKGPRRASTYQGGKARCCLHPDCSGRRGLSDQRSGLFELRGYLGTRRALRHPHLRRGPPTRLSESHRRGCPW